MPSQTSSPMTNAELRELAALDALSLLDEYESALFNRSFHLAPTTVQDEIRDLQAAVAEDETLLPDVQPRAELRQRVLSEIRKRADAEGDAFGPIGVIRPEPARTATGTGSRFFNSAPMWRAASFLLMTGLLVGGYFHINLQQLTAELTAHLNNKVSHETIIEQLGAKAEQLIEDPTTMKIALQPVLGADGEFNPAHYAILYVNEETTDACLVTFGLESDKEYRLTVRRNGETSELSSFLCNSDLQTHFLDLTTTAISALTIEITDVATGGVVLRSV